MPRPKVSDPRHAAAVVLILTVGLGACVSDAAIDWPEVEALIERDFPDIPSVTTTQLAALLDGPVNVILLDARAPDEYAVSHLEGAHLATSVAEARAALREAADDSVVVAYCSVGYRSARLTEALRADGLDNVYNLRGSIFAWANEGRTLYHGAERVDRVHPFTDQWSALLSPELHATIR